MMALKRTVERAPRKLTIRVKRRGAAGAWGRAEQAFTVLTLLSSCPERSHEGTGPTSAAWEGDPPGREDPYRVDL